MDSYMVGADTAVLENPTVVLKTNSLAAGQRLYSYSYSNTDSNTDRSFSLRDYPIRIAASFVDSI